MGNGTTLYFQQNSKSYSVYFVSNTKCSPIRRRRQRRASRQASIKLGRIRTRYAEQNADGRLGRFVDGSGHRAVSIDFLRAFHGGDAAPAVKANPKSQSRPRSHRYELRVNNYLNYLFVCRFLATIRLWIDQMQWLGYETNTVSYAPSSMRERAGSGQQPRLRRLAGEA